MKILQSIKQNPILAFILVIAMLLIFGLPFALRSESTRVSVCEERGGILIKTRGADICVQRSIIIPLK